jgi:hypothetical protein
MFLSRRIAVSCAAVALGVLGTVGVAHADSYGPDRPGDTNGQDQSDDYYTPDTDPEDTDSEDDSEDGNGCPPENSHDSGDLYRYPQCPGNRDRRDDGDHPGPEQNGLSGNLFGGH